MNFADMTYQDFVEFMKSPSAQCTIKFSWLREGCPKCGSKKWEVTSDGWAYCDGCNKGYPTDYPFTNAPIEVLDFTVKEE